MKKKISGLSPIEYVTPSMLRIFASMVYDTLLLSAISITYGALVVALRIIIYGQPSEGQRIEWGFVSGCMITVGWLLALMCFYIYFWHKFGQTLGMKTWRFQLVDAKTNQLPTYKQCFQRSLCALFSLLFLGIGYWMKFIHPQKRSLHDLASNTKLILLKKS